MAKVITQPIIVTHCELADGKIAHYMGVLTAARKQRGDTRTKTGDEVIAEERLNYWLDYRIEHKGC